MKPQRSSARLRAALVAAPVTALALVLAACGGPADAAAPAPAETPDEYGVATAPGDAGPIVIDHLQGSVELDEVPQRVFSFDWGITADLMALGVDVAGVPQRLVPEPFQVLLENDDLVDVGTVFEPDFETVAASGADLILIAQRSAPQHDELSRIAPTADVTINTGNNVEDSITRARQLGAIFGREAEAEALVERLEASMAEVRELTAETGDALMILTRGGVVQAFGPGGRFDVLHNELGFAYETEIGPDGRYGSEVSFEYLLEANPYWVFVIDRDTAVGAGGDAARVVLDNDIVRRMDAYQNNRMVFVNTTDWYLAGTGIATLQNIVDEVLAVLQAGHALNG